MDSETWKKRVASINNLLLGYQMLEQDSGLTEEQKMKMWILEKLAYLHNEPEPKENPA